MNENIDKAFKVALEARSNAHAPYSKFQVGAAIKVVGDDTIYPGCNVENASYGATVCAERNAIIGAVARNGKIEIEYVVVACNTDPVTVPCALCLQVISEFAKPEMPVYLGDLESVKKTVLFKDLLPMPFNTLDC
ncbi:cytidine deaminase [Halobacteriovorax sp. HLS]|uniref:cytidine deaminase n=1 Tax=Halobacteriovorax sp. HLS TaxID=2234000 RepID=UPI000FD8F51B|nr:cytidine deaminase [Halobacteriovorax sp. HLS]